MIAPVNTSLIQRTAPTGRVRRKLTDRAEATAEAGSVEEVDDTEETAEAAAPQGAAAGPGNDIRPGPRKVGPAVLAAIMELRHGG